MSCELRPLSIILMSIVVAAVVVLIMGQDVDGFQVGTEMILSENNQSVAMAMDGNDIHIAWIETPPANVSDYGTIFHRIYDGMTWGPKTPVADVMRLGLNGTPLIAVTNGKVHLIYGEYERVDRWIDRDFMYRYFDGSSWGPAFEVSEDHQMRDSPTYVAMDIRGEDVFVVWEDFDPDGYPYIYFRHKNGTDWLPIQKLSTGAYGKSPAISCSDDKVHVVWSYAKQIPFPRIRYYVRYKSYDGTTWSNSFNVVNGSEDVGFSSDIDASGDYVHVICKARHGVIGYRRLVGDNWGPLQLIDPNVPPNYVSQIDYRSLHITAVGEYGIIAATRSVMPWDKDNDGLVLIVTDGTREREPFFVRAPVENASIRLSSAELIEDTLHLVWRFDMDRSRNFTQVHCTVDIDTDLPTSFAFPADDYWQPINWTAIGWNATDDFGIDRVELYYRYSPDNATWTDWEQGGINDTVSWYEETGAFLFHLAVDGYYDFYTVTVDWLGNAETPPDVPDVRMAIDSVVPTCSVLIDEGRLYSPQSDIELTVSFNHPLTSAAQNASGTTLFMMRLSDDGEWDDELWQQAMTNATWTLPPGDGPWTVYLQVMSVSGLMSEIVSDDIIVDTETPWGSLLINGGAIYTINRSVVLEIFFTDEMSGVSGIRLIEDGNLDNVPWSDPTPVSNWTLEDDDGVRTIYLQVRDGAGHISSIVSADIYLDSTRPAVITTEPEDGERDVPRRPTIVVQFSERMNITSLEEAFAVYIGDTRVEGRLSFVSNRVTFDPEQRLRYDTSYRVVVGKDAEDEFGNHLLEPFEFEFRTEMAGTDWARYLWFAPFILVVITVVIGFIWRRTRRWPRRPA